MQKKTHAFCFVSAEKRKEHSLNDVWHVPFRIRLWLCIVFDSCYLQTNNKSQLLVSFAVSDMVWLWPPMKSLIG